MFNLAYKVSTDIRSLCEDTATHAHEHRKQCSTETETFEYARSTTLVDQNNNRCTEQTKTNCEHASHTTSAESDAHCILFARCISGGGHADVATNCEPHTHVSGYGREDCTHEEEDGTTNALTLRLSR